MPKEKKDKLALSNMFGGLTIDKNFGQSITTAAIDSIKKQRGEHLVNFIAGTIRQIEDLERQIGERQTWLKFQRDRLQAINDGEFTLNAQYMPIFNDGRLNG